MDSRFRGNDGVIGVLTAAMLFKPVQLGNKNFFGKFATLTSNL
jgi:hypothetical protein